MQKPNRVAINGITFNDDLSLPGPYLVDGCDTIVKLFSLRCQELGERTAHREKDYGIWLSYSWKDYHEHARLIGLGLLSLGLERGEVVSILSEDRKEWVYCDLGVQCVGAIASGIYTTDSAAQVEYLINNSGSRFLFLENDEQLDKYLTIENQVPVLEWVIVLDQDGLHDFTHERVIFLDELYRIGRAFLRDNPDRFENEIAKSRPDETAMLVYTSGTTGAPKGAMISHQNVMYSLSIGPKTTPVLSTDEQVCFLPLCHILERLISVQQPLVFKSTVNFAESPETVFDNIQEVSPHIFTAVPRVWEKAYSRVSLLAGDATPLGRWAYRMALQCGAHRARLLEEKRKLPLTTRIGYRFWDFVVLRNLRRMLGMDRLRRGTTGAAPISADLLRWFASIGVTVLEGYGMTESAGIISVNRMDRNRVGTVGPLVPGSMVRFSDAGEIEYHAGNVFQGYWKNPEGTAKALTEDGWLRTGDLGYLDDQQFLNITGRAKDIIITAGGKNISPAEIENQLKFSPYISDAVVIGDKRRFLSCLIMIDQENVEKYAQDHRIPFNDFRSLCQAREVRDLIGEVIATTNRNFARVEQIRQYRLIDVLLTAEDDELTATMKLKRSFVESRHRVLIDEMYT